VGHFKIFRETLCPSAFVAIYFKGLFAAKAQNHEETQIENPI